MPALTSARALAWRMRRQLLDPVDGGSVADVVARLGAVPAWPDSAAELAIGARRSSGRSGDAARALEERKVVKVYAYRGATHLMTPQDAGAHLALRLSSRMWELPSWQSYYRLSPADWPRFREFVRAALADGPVTRSELAAAFTGSSGYRHLSTFITDGNDTLLKPLNWQGDMGFGPPRDGEHTFLALADVPGWAGVPDLDDAGPTVLAAYLHTYGPAAPERLHAWFGKGLGAKRRDLTRWLDGLGDRLEEVLVDGTPELVLAEDLDELMATPASSAVRLLPGRDPYVMAPGTADTRVVPAAHREPVSRSANTVVHRGAVAGTWALQGEALAVSWFSAAGRVPRSGLAGAADELGRSLGRTLELAVATQPAMTSS